MRQPSTERVLERKMRTMDSSGQSAYF